MKFQIKSNYDKFERHLNKFVDSLDIDARLAMEDVLEYVCEEMKQEILNKKDTWCEAWSPLAEDSTLGSDIHYEIKDNKATIYIGRDTKKITMQDGTTVNPYYFIEFGWGIVGENNPVNYHLQNGWIYNVNKHTQAWWYVGYNGEPRASYGRQGIDFLYNAMKKLKPNLEAALGERLKKRWYGT